MDELLGLTPIEFYKGSKGTHPTVLCRCRCGKTRVVRQSLWRRGVVSSCASCSLKGGWRKRVRPSSEERRLLAKESEYRQGAKSRTLEWALSRDQFRKIFTEPCTYCGDVARGIDRSDNAAGYSVANSVPCCSACNYAKRDMSVADFLDMVGKVYRHSGVRNA